MTKLEAEIGYRWAFSLWRRATSEAARKPYEKIMDSLQPKIARGPGPEWSAFVDTMPGYRESWGQSIQALVDEANKKTKEQS